MIKREKEHERIEIIKSFININLLSMPSDKMHLCVKRKINIHFKLILVSYYYNLHDYYLVSKRVIFLTRKRCEEYYKSGLTINTLVH